MIWIFPYLPLAERLSVGPWTLIPRAQFEDEDATSLEAAATARGIATLYRLPQADRACGAFVRSADCAVGEEVDEAALGRLGQTVTVALLDCNPSPVEPPKNDWQRAYATSTAENSRLIGHGVDANGYTSYAFGVMRTMWKTGYKVGEDAAVIPPPPELELPLNPPQIDTVYANALYKVLGDLAEDDPDLPGAIRFLEVTWANTRSVSAEARILALRAGFDVLFGGAQTKKVRNRLSRLLDDARARRTRRHWIEHGDAKEQDLTDLQWWFQSFALLRNKIAHGGAVAAEEWVFDDVDHVFHGELRLRRAIKKIVANAGHEEVLRDPFERIAHDWAERLAEAARADAAATDAGSDETDG